MKCRLRNVRIYLGCRRSMTCIRAVFLFYGCILFKQCVIPSSLRCHRVTQRILGCVSTTTHSKAATVTNLGAGSQACLSRARLVHQTRHLLTAENRRLMPMAQRTQRTYARLRWQGTDPALESCRCLNVGWALQGPEALTDLQLGWC